jgi:hypothetical protein
MEEQHEVLRQTVETLRPVLEAAAAPGAGDETRSDARALLTLLARELPTHFAFEERVGVLAAAVAEAPHLARRADSLLRDHGRLAKIAAAVRMRADRAEDACERWEWVRDAFALLHGELLEHERGEGRILQQAYLDDLGSGD